MSGIVRKLMRQHETIYIPIPKVLAELSGFSKANEVLISIVFEGRLLVEVLNGKEILKDRG